MKSVVVASSLMAALALSTPLEKRYFVTETDEFTVTVTQTGSGADATGGHHWGGWSQQADPATTSSTTTTATSAAWVPSTFSTVEAHVGTKTSTSVPSTFSTHEAPASTPAATNAPASSTWSSAPSSGSAPPSGGSVSGYAQAILDQHNNHRANHSAPALVWDDNMASIAQQIGQSCVYAHNTNAGGGGYGQNIGAGAGPSGVPALITNEMYNNEIGFYPLPYGQAQPDMSKFEKWGHFSQIIWQSTTSIGCATVDCSASGLANAGSGISPWFTVCNYKPAGNFANEYGKNVGQPLGNPTVTLPG